MEKGNGFIIDVNQKNERKLREFVTGISGLTIRHLDRILRQDNNQFDRLYLQLSYNLKEQMIICLYGRLDYMRYGPKIINVDNFIRKYKDEFITMKNVVIIKHIPHASLEFPKEIHHGGIINFEEKYNLKMSDIGIDYLFRNINGIEIKAPYSRLFCDVEKFKDDSKEEMSKIGQGYIYKKYFDGNDISRFTHSGDLCIKSYINNYYDNYHRELDNTVQTLLKEGKRVLILDLHSYSDELAISNGNKPPFPDICIGINDEYCDKDILELIIRKIEEKGYSYKINYPYKGSILPNGLIEKKYNGDVSSIMLEVNKRIYL